MFKNALNILRARTWEILGAFIALLALAFAFETRYFEQKFSIITLPKLIVAATVFVACARCLLANETAKGFSLRSPRQPAGGAPAQFSFRVFMWVILLWLLTLLASSAVGFTVYINHYGIDLSSDSNDLLEHLHLTTIFESTIKYFLFITFVEALFYGLTMALFGTKIPAMAVGAEHGFKTTLIRGRRTFFFVLGRLILGPLIVRALFVVVGFSSLALLPPNALLPYISIFFVTLGFVISILLEGTIYAMALQRAEPDLKVKLQDAEQPPAP